MTSFKYWFEANGHAEIVMYSVVWNYKFYEHDLVLSLDGMMWIQIET